MPRASWCQQRDDRAVFVAVRTDALVAAGHSFAVDAIQYLQRVA